MREGRVLVDGRAVTEPGAKADPELAAIMVDGQAISAPNSPVYYMFHKPAGFLTTLSDPYDRPTISPFLAKLPVRVYPVGRLDFDVSGLLILTNDGELCARLMHPSYEVPKVYHALVEGIPEEKDLEKLRSGNLIILDKPAAPAKARILNSGPDKGWLELTLTEGRHRQVKRMCAAIGHKVKKLKRVAYCGLKIPPALAQGEATKLTRNQIVALKSKVGL
jgi:23S rRNA pseudouridine2605 synthase